MELYIDRTNLINIFQNKEHPLFPDVIKIIKKQLDINFNFSKKQAIEDEVLSFISQVFTEGVSQDSVYKFSDILYPERHVKSNLHTRHPNKQSIFLIDDEKLELCKQKKGLLIFGLGEEFDCFNTLFLLQDDYLFEKKINIRSTSFNGWNKIKDYAYPFTDFILIDNFIFSLPDIIEHNLFEIIRTLFAGKQLAANIIIFTNKSHVHTPVEELTRNIATLVSHVTGVRSSCTIITWRDQRGIETFAEHDRTIFTNYLRFYSGDSFNYWDHTGKKITKGREFDITSLAKRENYVLAQQLIADLNEFVQNCNPENITGDRKSNFINFL